MGLGVVGARRRLLKGGGRVAGRRGLEYHCGLPILLWSGGGGARVGVPLLVLVLLLLLMVDLLLSYLLLLLMVDLLLSYLLLLLMVDLLLSYLLLLPIGNLLLSHSLLLLLLLRPLLPPVVGPGFAARRSPGCATPFPRCCRHAIQCGGAITPVVDHHHPRRGRRRRTPLIRSCLLLSRLLGRRPLGPRPLGPRLLGPCRKAGRLPPPPATRLRPAQLVPSLLGCDLLLHLADHRPDPGATSRRRGTFARCG
mmetsp:Transcript_101067/g.231833  ORF Transcript_101067/g.231833 Transcript_101067/m.231833 type:complete len:252 (-) Transcript_101067:706-1461(-)